MECKSKLMQVLDAFPSYNWYGDLWVEFVSKFQCPQLQVSLSSSITNDTSARDSTSLEVPESITSMHIPESGADTWDYDRNCWSKKRTSLCTYEWYIWLSPHIDSKISSRCWFMAIGRNISDLLHVALLLYD